MPLDHPYTNLTGGQWLRGNLHAHSNRSDGERTPENVIADYVKRGYGFLMLSDHDILATREECAAWTKQHGIVMIPGNEISANGPHLLHVDADLFVAPERSRQEIFNRINAAGVAAGKGLRGFSVVNHPNWFASFDHCSIQQMREWSGYVGLEIYNGVISRLEGSPYATNKWDILLNEGRRLWGFANDDSHKATGDTELGWNTAYVKERTVEGVVEALLAGRFYASTGVTITNIEVNDDTIRIETDNAQRITALVNTAKRIATADGKVIEVKMPAGAKYLRFECWGPGESFAWTQPFFARETARGAGARPAKQFIENWEVADRFEELDLADAKVNAADTRRWTPITALQPPHAATGLLDARLHINGQPGVLYFRTNIKSDADRRAKLFLGYDGPIRAWLNSQQIFEGPGSNPAVADKAALFANLKNGDNKLVVALDTNGGQAWGINARVEM